MAVKILNALFIDDNVQISENAINVENYDSGEAVNGIVAGTPKGPRAGMIAMLEASTGKAIVHRHATVTTYEAVRPLGIFRADLRKGSGEDIGTGHQTPSIVPEPGMTVARKLPIIRGSAVLEVDIFADRSYTNGDILYNYLKRGVLTNLKPSSQSGVSSPRNDELAIVLKTADSEGFMKIHWILS